MNKLNWNRWLLMSVCVMIVGLVVVHPGPAERAVSASPTTAQGATFTVNTANDGSDTNPGDGVCQAASGDCTFRAATEEANASAGADTIRFTAQFTHDLNGMPLSLTENVTIIGQPGSLFATHIDADGAATCLVVNGGVTADISNVDISGCSVNAIINLGTLNLSDSWIFGNGSSGGGAGIANFDGTLNGDGLLVSQNQGIDGAGILNDGGVLNIKNSTIDNNTASGRGGGIFSTGSSSQPLLTVENSTIADNTAADGGGIFIEEGQGNEIINTEIRRNAVTGSGGGLGVVNSASHLLGVTINIEDSLVADNDAPNVIGGGVYLNDIGLATIVRTDIRDNVALLGGGIYVTENSIASELRLEESLIYRNEALSLGGGLRVRLASEVSILNTTISSNMAQSNSGGGLDIQSSNVTMHHVTLFANSAATTGKEIQVNGGSLRLLNTAVAGYSGSVCAQSNSPAITFAGSYTTTAGCFSLPATSILAGALADNGGPTASHLPDMASGIVDAGSPAHCLSVDQRGFTRVNQDGNGNPSDGNQCDVGAIEVQGGGFEIYLPMVVR